MTLENSIAAFVKKRGVKLTAVSKGTGISYMALYDSLFNENKTRQIKGSELIAVCDFLGVSPMEFKKDMKEGD